MNFLSLGFLLLAQGLDPKAIQLFSRPADAWPTYNGDYSGRRFAADAQIKPANIDMLAMKWMFRIQGVGSQRGVGSPRISSTPLLWNGVLYFTIPNHVYAIDAKSGEEIWHYEWVDKGGHLVGNRGVGIYKDWVYFLGPDGWFISLDAKTGKERWRKQVADARFQYFTTMSPMIVKDHVIVGVGGDAMDVQGFLEARDPETGELQWRWYSTPQKKTDPGGDTWPNEDAMKHGGGMTWLPGTYDPELNLLYWGTGNVNPVFAGQGRKGANLYTCSIVALNADTGKLAWYFQVSPHDTHDWDNVETPVLFDMTIDGRPRKLLAQAARNGYFVVLDRTNGKYLVSTGFSGVNWSKGIDERGQPIPDPAKEPKVDGSKIHMAGGGATNWMPPSYNPNTELFYVNARDGFSVTYLTDTSDNPQGYAGGGGGGYSYGVIKALEVRTGKVRWSHRWPGGGGAGNSGPGLLSTTTGLLFTGDPTGNFLAFDGADGKILWHFPLHAPVTNGPMTFTLDGKQYVLAGAGDTLYAFALIRP